MALVHGITEGAVLHNVADMAEEAEYLAIWLNSEWLNVKKADAFCGGQFTMRSCNSRDSQAGIQAKAA
jgi:hypothetical protein